MDDGQLPDTSDKDRRNVLFDFFATQPDNKGIIFTCIGIMLVIGFGTFFFFKTSMPITTTYSKVNQSSSQPFVVNLNETVRNITLSDMKISPTVSGKWTFKSGILVGRDKITFTPTSYFKVNTTYNVTFGSARRILFGSQQINNVQFKTEIAPDLTKAGINGVQNDSSVAADYVFKVDLATPNKGLRKLEIRTVPNIPMTQTVINDRQFSWKPTGLLPQGTTLSVQIYDAKNDIVLTTKTFKVTNEPAISVPVKESYFGEKDVATITFNQPMDPISSKYIIFSTAGQGKWQSDTVYSFTPQSVSPGQTYNYTLNVGLRSKSGGILTENKTASFSTVGSVIITGSSPNGTNLSQSSEQIKFSFDQAVDHTSAVNHFSISSGKIISTSWQGNTFIANVADLGYQQTVTAVMSAGIQNAGFGLPSTQSFSNTFTTEIRVNRLNVPYYHQQYAATCSAASLRMILAYRGIATDDMSIVYKMGYNPTVLDKSTDPPTWDDPQLMFVGSVDGTIRTGTSAGPDAQPVANAAKSYGVNATAVTDINVAWIAEQLYNNNPVVFFGAYSNTAFTSWKTPSGRIESMNLTGHARVVTGVKGEPSNPIGFWISDPLSGTSYWTASQVTANINLDAYKQAAVVY